MSYMDRHEWAVVVCLVGGGQEINTGEATTMHVMSRTRFQRGTERPAEGETTGAALRLEACIGWTPARFG